jgi:hypothetical protein
MHVKKLRLLATALCLVVLFLSATCWATPLYVPAEPVATPDGVVTIPPLPEGCRLINVVVYNDDVGATPRNLGPACRFQLRPGEGFNFLWQGPDGRTWYQMITPASDSRSRGFLRVDCSCPTGCKFIFIPPATCGGL